MKRKKKAAPVLSESLVLASLKIILSLAVILFLLLICAGRPDYRQAYAFTLANAVVLGATLYFLKDRPGLIHERTKPGPGMKEWDKIFYAVNTPLYLLILVTGALDSGRFGWSGDISAAVTAFSYLLYFSGQGIFLWAKTVNSFLSPVARIQKDRKQKVVEDGPYRIIRHPSYFGGILFTLATPLMLGSWWALIPATLSAGALAVRTGLEDDMLRKELKGYARYTEKVKYRLIPGIW